ncbi:MAG: M15 family peptidase [Hyphomicrobiaceae bacterium]|nr:MAG: M15 family peptidase [Hyphomicrobiaceae bacterium]
MTKYEEKSEALLREVNPELSWRVRQVLAAMMCLGYPMVVTNGNRTTVEQQALYAQGRTKPGKVVTNADGVKNKSNHQDARAVDCTFLDAKGQPHWPDTAADQPKWRAYGACAKALGLAWGGDWKKADKPHVEMTK